MDAWSRRRRRRRRRRCSVRTSCSTPPPYSLFHGSPRSCFTMALGMRRVYQANNPSDLYLVGSSAGMRGAGNRLRQCPWGFVPCLAGRVTFLSIDLALCFVAISTRLVATCPGSIWILLLPLGVRETLGRRVGTGALGHWGTASPLHPVWSVQCSSPSAMYIEYTMYTSHSPPSTSRVMQ